MTAESVVKSATKESSVLGRLQVINERLASIADKLGTVVAIQVENKEGIESTLLLDRAEGDLTDVLEYIDVISRQVDNILSRM